MEADGSTAAAPIKGLRPYLTMHRWARRLTTPHPPWWLLLVGRYQLDPAVLCPALGGLVGRHEVRLAEALRYQLARRNTLVLKVCRDRFCPPLRQFQVVRYRANAIAIAVDVHLHVRVSLQRFGCLIQHRLVHVADVVLVEVEVHSAQYDLLRRRRRWRRWRRWWRRRRRRCRRWRRRQQVPDDSTNQCTTHYACRNRGPVVALISGPY